MEPSALSFNYVEALATLASSPGAAILKRGPTIPARALALYTAAVASLLAALLGGGLALLGSQYMAIDPELQQNSFLTPSATLGVLLVLLGCALGPLALGFWLLALSQRAGRGLSAGAAAALAGAALAGCLGLCAWAWAALIVPGETYHRGTLTNNQPDTLKQFLGGLLFAAFAPVTAVAARICAALAGRAWGGSGDAAPAAAARPPTPFQNERLASNWRGFAALAALSLVVTAGTATCTPVWNYSSTSYFTSPALDGLSGSRSWSLLSPSLKLTLGPPPADPTAWMQPVVYIKLYEDVVVFFGLLLGVAAVGLLGTYHAPLRRALHARLDVGLPKALRALDPFPLGACLGELLLAGVVAALYVYWVYFWSTRYTRISNEAAVLGDAHPALHVAARVTGHLTTLTMSLLCFPVARNSVWEATFGVPFDRAVKFHRIMGTLCWVLATLHMVLWQVKWYMEGNLLNNITTVRHLLVVPCEASNLPCFRAPDGLAYAVSDGIPPPAPPVPCPCVFYSNFSAAPAASGAAPLVNSADHADNFTIVIVEAAWLLLTVALSVAVWGRRAHYEAFLATHHAVLLFFAAGLVHAWSHWYYTAAGLLLFAFDKALRAVNAAREVRTLSLEYARPGVTRLRVGAGFLRGAPLHAGQYVWLCVPAVSATQWHPFTVSSPPSAAAGAAGELTFHIKDMGAGTWTGRLGALARAMRVATREASAHSNRGAAQRERLEGAEDAALLPVVSVDGPYGRVGAVEGRDTLVLVAGGIGVTPVHALACELAARRGGGCGEAPAGLARVVVVWVVRDTELLEAFAEGFAPLLSDPFFELHIHASQGGTRVQGGGGGKGGGGGGEAAGAPLLGGGGASDTDDSAVGAGWARQSASDALAAATRWSRPNIDAIIGEAARGAAARARGGEGGGGGGVLAFVCGPEGLVETVSRAAFAHGTDFHAEVFSF